MTRSVSSRSAQPFGRVVDQAAPRQFVEQIRHWSAIYYISLMAITRRALLKTLVATGASARSTGAGAYGYLYERHALGVTESDVPVSGLPPPLAGLRVGLLTDVHRSRWVSHDDVARGCRHC